MYGQELILDIHDCVTLPCGREFIKQYFIELCDLIGMKRGELFFWDYDGLPEEYESAPDHLKGISAVQFIMTSNITIHTLDNLKKIFINIFSCKQFDTNKAATFTVNYFMGEIKNRSEVKRI